LSIALGTLEVVLWNNKLNDLIGIFTILTKQMNQKNVKELAAIYFRCIYKFPHHMHVWALVTTLN